MFYPYLFLSPYFGARGRPGGGAVDSFEIVSIEGKQEMSQSHSTDHKALNAEIRNVNT